MLLVMAFYYCNFCSTKIYPKKGERDNGLWKFLSALEIMKSLHNFKTLQNANVWAVKTHIRQKHYKGTGLKSICESCSDLDLYLKPDEVYGQVWDVKKVLENSHLNLAQQKVYLKYGLIDPRVAVERIKLDNTWQDPDYPTLTLEDLNYRHLSLFQQIPTGFYLVPVIILGLMILNDSWFIKFLGISGMGGFFYWLHQKEKAEKDTT
mgnify:CR=1 FL=1